LNAAVEVADKFLEKGKLIVYTEGRKQNQDMRFVAHQDFTHPNYPMVILVNHGSASASEIVAGALQAHGRAVVLGTQTYGKGSVQSVIPLSDNSGLRLTTATYFTPDGRSIHEKGITPDIVVELETPPTDVEEAEHQETPENDESPAPPDANMQDPGNDGNDSDDLQESPEAEYPEIAELLKRDNQLRRAVDILKGILILQKRTSTAISSSQRGEAYIPRFKIS
jgi:carboxyl-terminal processing protease